MASPASGAATAARLLAIALAVASASVAFRLSSSAVLGSHDEGVYIAAARALASGQGYRLTNLPSAPRETKYPPAYSALLTLGRPAISSDSDDFKRLRIVNAVCLAVIVVLTAALAGRLSNGSPVAVGTAALLAATSLALVSQVDLLESDLLFDVFVLLGLLSAPSESRTGRWWAAAMGASFGLAILTRTAGVLIALGAAVWLAFRSRRDAIVMAATCGCLAGIWAVWAAYVGDAAASQLERYYTHYDHIVWLEVLTHPAYVFSVVTTNAASYALALPAQLGAPNGFTAFVIAAGALVGIRGSRTSETNQLIGAITVPYAIQLLGVPYLADRYLLPLVPAVCAWLGVAAGRSLEPMPLYRRALGVLSVSVALVLGTLELKQYANIPTSRIHVGLGRTLPFSNRGFLETASWIRKATPPDAIVGSAYDTFYFVHTGRRGLRPWPYEPDHYNPGYSPPQTAASVDDVSQELVRLGVSYVVADPYLFDPEGDNARRYLSVILTAPASCWSPVFESSDHLHRVFARCQPNVESSRR